MTHSGHPGRVRPPSLLGLLALLVLAAAPATAAPAAPPFGTRARLAQPLGPQTELALSSLLDQSLPRLQRLHQEHMEMVVQELQHLFGLSEAEVAGLKLDATAMVRLATGQWKERALASLRLQVRRQQDDVTMAAWVENEWRPINLVPDHLVEEWTPPEQQPHWQKALEKRLGEQRATQWLQLRDEQRRRQAPAIEEFLRQWASACRKPLDQRLAEHGRLLETAAQLTPELTARITSACKCLVDEHMAAEVSTCRSMLEDVPDATIDWILSVEQMEVLFVAPTDEELDAAWQSLATQVTGPEAVAAWQAESSRLKGEEKRRLEAIIQPSMDAARIAMEEGMDMILLRWIAALDLDAARQAKLERLAEAAMEHGLLVARDRWIAQLAALAKQGKDPAREFGETDFIYTDDPEQLPVWNQGLKEMFTAEELSLGNADRGVVNRNRLCKSLARAVVAEADQLLLLDETQRRELERLVVAADKALPVDDRWNFKQNELYGFVLKLPPEKLRAILDAEQLKWLAEAEGGTPSSDEPHTAAVAPPPVGEAATGNDVTVSLARPLYAYANQARSRLLVRMRIRVKEAQRILSLPENKTQELGLAAKGAVETVMQTWREEMAKVARTELNNEPAEKACDYLGLLVPEFYHSLPKPEQTQVWTTFMSKVLTPEQTAVWQRNNQARRDYGITSVVETATAELACRYFLTDTQCLKFRALLAPGAATLLSALEDDFEAKDWQLGIYSCLAPVGSLTDAELRAVLSQRQWRLLAEDLATIREIWQHGQNRMAAKRAAQQAGPEDEIPVK